MGVSRVQKIRFPASYVCKASLPSKQGLIKALRQGIMKARNPLIFDHMFSWSGVGMQGSGLPLSIPMMLDYKIRLEMGITSWTPQNFM